MKQASFYRSVKDKFPERILLNSISTRFLSAESQTIKKQLEIKEVIIPNHHLEADIQHYQWRIKTQFPIVKIISYKILTKKQRNTSLAIQIESYPIRLADLTTIPLFKLLYLLKESVIGFERLYNKFGPFTISNKMIALNQQNKCKIWLNEDFASNQFNSIQVSEKEFISMVCNLFVSVCNKLKKTQAFFSQLQTRTSFCQILSFIENFARENKISIQSHCPIQTKQCKQKEKKTLSTFNPTLTMNRYPRFLGSNDLRSSLKDNSKQEFFKSINTPKQKQQPTPQYSKLGMKISGDTAADLNASNTMTNSFNGQKQILDESILFGQLPQPQQKKIPQNPLMFSKKIKQSKITRYFSANTDLSSFCSSPIAQSIHSSKQLIQPILKRQVMMKDAFSQSEDSDVENGEELKQSIKDIFNKNKWVKNIDGLFSNIQVMKKSAHIGVEKKINSSTKQLLLLQSISKDTHESFINDTPSYKKQF